MNKLLIILLLPFLLVNCSPKKQSKAEDLIAKRDSLREVQKSLAEQIKSLEEEIKAAGGKIGEEKSVLVTTAQVSTGLFEHYFEVQGQVESDKNVTLTSESAGAVKKIYVTEGQQVRAGQTIAELDRQLIDQSLSELKEQTELARFVFEKQEKLWKQNIGSELQYRQAKANYDGLVQRQRQLQTQRSRAFITAPFSGAVNDVFVKVGESLAPGMPVARIVNLNDLEVKADVSESYVGKVKAGSKATLFFNATGQEYVGKLTKIGSFINPSGRTFEIAASLPANAELLPNQVAQVKIRDYVNEDATMVPTRAILQDSEGNSYVYVVSSNKELPTVKKVSVTTGLASDNITEIQSGLAGNEIVVVEGVNSLNDGDRINIEK